MDGESLHERLAEVGDIFVDMDWIEDIVGTPVSAIVPLEGGSINRVARIELDDGEPLILRIAPSRQETEFAPSWLTHRKLEDEQRSIRRLSKLKPIKRLLPTTVHFEQSLSPGIGDVVIQTLVPGQPAASAIPLMTDDQRLDFYCQLGEMTQDIHSVRADTFGPGWNDDYFDTWSELILSDCEGFLEDAHTTEISTVSFTSLIELVMAKRKELDSVRGVLIHSDLSMEHVFVEQKAKRWKITGLIDLEYARFADPVSEGLLLDMLQRSDAESETFFEGYGWDLDVSDLRIDVACQLQAAWEITGQARLRESQ